MKRSITSSFTGLTAAALALGLLAGCSRTADDPATTKPQATGAKPGRPVDQAADTLDILVTNDDGVGAPGIDALVQALEQLPDTTITVWAPAQNQSGSSDSTTPGGLAGTPARTASGHEAMAVPGYPADAVLAALDAGVTPDVVVSGNNAGQNIGPLTELSGTVGAARTAARRGVPAVAVSQGLSDTPAFGDGAKIAAQWVQQHRADYHPGADTSTIVSINVPTCDTGTRGPLVQKPVASDAGGRDLFAVRCPGPQAEAVDGVAPIDDVAAFLAGSATWSLVPTGD